MLMSNFFKTLGDYSKAVSVAARTTSVGFFYNGLDTIAFPIAAVGTLFSINDVYTALSSADDKANRKLTKLRTQRNENAHPDILRSEKRLSNSSTAKNLALFFMTLGLSVDIVLSIMAFSTHSKDNKDAPSQKEMIDQLFLRFRYFGLASTFVSQTSEWWSKLSYKRTIESLDDALEIPPMPSLALASPANPSGRR